MLNFDLDNLLNFEYDLDLLRRVENNQPITKAEYFYLEYSLPLKLISLNLIKCNIKKEEEKNV